MELASTYRATAHRIAHEFDCRPPYLPAARRTSRPPLAFRLSKRSNDLRVDGPLRDLPNCASAIKSAAFLCPGTPRLPPFFAPLLKSEWRLAHKLISIPAPPSPTRAQTRLPGRTAPSAAPARDLRAGLQRLLQGNAIANQRRNKSQPRAIFGHAGTDSPARFGTITVS